MEEWNATKGDYLQIENENAFYSTFLSESRFWIQRVLLPLVVIVGVIGNGRLHRPKSFDHLVTLLASSSIQVSPSWF